MANRRMISKSISVSDQANDLSDFAALLFTWMIPHADDYGIISGSPKKIKALVIPMRKQTPKQVEEALNDMQKHELIVRYEYKGEQYLQFTGWESHQEGLHKRTAPKNPIYSEIKDDLENFREIPGNSGKFPPKGTKEKGREEKGKEVEGQPEIPEEKIKYAPHVTLTLNEHNTLIKKYGKEQTEWMIEKLENWKLDKGKINPKPNESDYGKINNWVVKAYNEEHSRSPDKSVLDMASWKAKQYPPDPLCKECGGTGKIKYQTDDGSGGVLKQEVTCDCVKRKREG